MGNGQSTPSDGNFGALYSRLPDDVHDQIEALCAKDDMRLLQANAKAPPPFPQTIVGMTVRLNPSIASAALAIVPRLQRKHYELIPKHLTELEFFISFFSHLTAIVEHNCPGAMALEEEVEGSWKGVAGSEDGSNSFDTAWAAMSDEKRKAFTCATRCRRDSDASLSALSFLSPPHLPCTPLSTPLSTLPRLTPLLPH